MKKNVLGFFVAIMLISSCKKDDDNGHDYQINTGLATNITNKEASISGSISGLNGKNIISYGHVWSTSSNPTIDLNLKTSFGNTSADTIFTSVLKPLMQGTHYYVRAYASDSINTFYGSEVSVQTLESFFEFVVSSNFLYQSVSTHTRAWVMIYSSGNQLLNISEIFNGNSFAFDWPTKTPTDNYKVQIFKFTDYQNSTNPYNYSMSTYLDVEPEVWYLGTEQKEGFSIIGSETVTLTDFDLFGYYAQEARNNFSTFSSYENQTLTFHQYMNPDNIWITFYDEDEAPYFKWIGNVGLNQSFNYAYSDFLQMTDYVNFSLPQNTFGRVHIYSEDNPDTENIEESFSVYYANADGKTSVKCYYPGNLFKGYYFYTYYMNDNILETMTKSSGAIPAKFVSLPATITVINENVHSFSATITSDVDINCSTWYYWQDGCFFNYSIFGSVNSVSSFAAPALPQELKALNESQLDLDKLQYSSSSFVDYDNLKGFEDYIFNSFVQPSVSSEAWNFCYDKCIYKSRADKKYFGMEEGEMMKRLKKPTNFKMQFTD